MPLTDDTEDGELNVRAIRRFGRIGKYKEMLFLVAKCSFTS